MLKLKINKNFFTNFQPHKCVGIGIGQFQNYQCNRKERHYHYQAVGEKMGKRLPNWGAAKIRKQMINKN